MIFIEQQIETGLRAAIRAALQAASATVPELAACKIVCHWLPAENDGDDNDADGLRVFVKANPNASQGYHPSTGFMRVRTVSVEIGCVSQPDSDRERRVTCALYTTVRGVFEAAPFAADIGAGVQFGGMLITGGGTADIDDVGQVTSFTIEMTVALT